MSERVLEEHITGCTAAHRRLVAHLEELLGAGQLDASASSRLPDWTVGHVLTHLARNADSFVGVIESAARGEVSYQYPSMEAREEGIAQGAPRPAAEQVADVRRSIEALGAAFAGCTDETWSGRWRNAFGEQSIDEVPFRRWREVEIHHADLGLPGFDFQDMSPRYVTEELSRRTMEWGSRQPMGMTSLPPEALALPPPIRVAWLMGRLTPPGLEPVRFP